MQKCVRLVALVGFISSLGLPSAAAAASFNLAAVIPNIGFESGLAGWTYTGAGVNANTYLTNAEWAAQNWSNSSPFYTDAQLTTFYPGQPWGLNPDITHVQQTGGPVDPGGVVGAAVGNNFVGSRQDGYSGHYLTGGGPSSPVSYYDTNFQLKYTVNTPFQNGDTFSLITWGNRGRINDDWEQINASSSGSASTLSFRLFGDAATDFNSTCTFTNWGVDGAWSSQTCTWILDRNVSSISLFVTGQNSNHDRYVAVDMGDTPVTFNSVPEPASIALLGTGLLGLAAAARRRKSAQGKS